MKSLMKTNPVNKLDQLLIVILKLKVHFEEFENGLKPIKVIKLENYFPLTTDEYVLFHERTFYHSRVLESPETCFVNLMYINNSPRDYKTVFMQN